MPSVCYGTPNLYFLFWAMGIHNLKQDSELVYIVPRSWTSGAYFKRFRQYLFKHCVITDMHLFESRDKVFDGESVLQETIIIKVKKTKRIPDYVSITSSSTSSFEDIVHFVLLMKQLWLKISSSISLRMTKMQWFSIKSIVFLKLCLN